MRKSIILVGIVALGLILLAGCRQRPREVELEERELLPLEEMVPLEEVAEVPMFVEVPPAVAPPAVVVGKININTATQAQLETLPGIGPTKAQAIIAGRPYATVDDLTRVKGIGPATLEKLRPQVTVK